MLLPCGILFIFLSLPTSKSLNETEFQSIMKQAAELPPGEARKAILSQIPIEDLDQEYVATRKSASSTQEPYNAYLAFRIADPSFDKLVTEIKRLSYNTSDNFGNVFTKPLIKYELRLLNFYVEKDGWDRVPEMWDTEMVRALCEHQHIRFQGTSISFPNRELLNVGAACDTVDAKWLNAIRESARVVAENSGYRHDGENATHYSTAVFQGVSLHEISKRDKSLALECTVDFMRFGNKMLETIVSGFFNCGDSIWSANVPVDGIYLCRQSNATDNTSSEFCDVIKQFNFDDCPNKAKVETQIPSKKYFWCP